MSASRSPAASLLCPLVGAFHRPPAKTVLEVLPHGCVLLLVPEPENPYDAGAIRVMVDLSALCADDDFATVLETALDAVGAGFDDVVHESGPLQLGYCAATGGKPLAKLAALWSQTGLSPVGNVEVAAMMDAPDSAKHATLEFGPDGHPAVRVTLGEPNDE